MPPCTRIGYAHPDRLLSYPDIAYLSGCVLVAGSPSPLRGRDRGSSSVTVTVYQDLLFRLV